METRKASTIGRLFAQSQALVQSLNEQFAHATSDTHFSEPDETALDQPGCSYASSPDTAIIGSHRPVRNWWDIKLSLDLVSAAQCELAFLNLVDRKTTAVLYDQNVLRNAIFRYEQYWLPLAARQKDVFLIPPLDIHWIWYLHMLAPSSYRQDCVNIAGKYVDHRLLDFAQIDKNYSKSATTWLNYYPMEPYDFIAASNRRRAFSYTQRSSFDFAEAIRKQQNVIFQISLPHFTSTKFLAEAFTRYRKFLFLRKLYPNEPLMPSCDILLMWHAHILHPCTYESEMMKLFGCVLEPDQLLCDDKLEPIMTIAEAVTSRIWVRHFPDKFWQRGAMFRGHYAPSCLGIEPCDSEVRIEKGVVHILSLTLRDLPTDRKRIEIIVSTFPSLSANCPRIPDVLYRGVTELLYGKKELTKFRSAFSLENSSGPEFSISWTIPGINQPAGDLSAPRFNFSRQHPALFEISLRLFDVIFGGIRKREVRFDGSLTLDQFLPSSNSQMPKNILCLNLIEVVPPSRRSDVSRSDSLRIVKTVCSNFLSQDQRFFLRLGDFELQELTPDSRLERLCAASALHSSALFGEDAKRRTINVATHTFTDSQNSKCFKAQVVHCASAVLSMILVFNHDETKLLALARLIGPESLPSKSQFDHHLHFLPSLSASNERAMTILNALGDYMIVKAKWSNYTKQPYTAQGTKPVTHGMANNSGQLEIEIFNLSKASVQKLALPDDSYSSKFFVGDAEAALSASVMKCASALNVAEQIASVLSIAVLFVLCDPERVRSPVDDSLDGIPCNKWPMVVAAGYGRQQIPTNKYLAAKHLRASRRQSSVRPKPSRRDAALFTAHENPPIPNGILCYSEEPDSLTVDKMANVNINDCEAECD